MKRMALYLAVGTAAASLIGCSSMSGLDAKTSFSCKAPEGVQCESMEGVYSNAMQHNLPGQRVNAGKSAAATSGDVKEGSGVLTRPIYSGTPIRSAPRVLRIWFAPWEDSDGDLHDQSYVYLPVDNGRWLVEHNRRRIQDTYRPVRAPAAATQGNSGSRPQQSGISDEAGPVRMDRPSSEAAAKMMSGLLTPAGQFKGQAQE